MFCVNCGKQLADDAKFCSVCGNAVGQQGGSQPDIGMKKPLGKLPIIIGVGTFIVVIAVSALISGFGDKDVKNEVKEDRKVSNMPIKTVKEESPELSNTVEEVFGQSIEYQDTSGYPYKSTAEVLDFSENGEEDPSKDLQGWKKAYVSGLDDGTIPWEEYIKYSLLDITGDGIPEMVIYDESIYGTGIYTVSGGKVKEMLYVPGDFHFDNNGSMFIISRYEMAAYKIHSDSVELVFSAMRNFDSEAYEYEFEGGSTDYDGCMEEIKKRGIDVESMMMLISEIGWLDVKTMIINF